MAAYRRPTSRTAKTDAKRAPTQLMPQVQPPNAKTTVKVAAAPAPSTPPVDAAPASSEPETSVSPAAEAITNPFTKPAPRSAPAPAPAARPAPPTPQPPAKAAAVAPRPSTPAPGSAAAKALAKTTIIPANKTPTKNQALPATPAPATAPATPSPHRANTEYRTRKGESSSATPRRGSSRLEKASAKDKASSKRAVERKPRGKARSWPLYVILGLVAVVIITALSWKPYLRHHAVKTMDAAKTDPSRHDAALQAADAYLGLVDKDPAEVDNLVANDHGPIAVQIHLVEAVGLFPRLVSMSERSDLSASDRAQVLSAAASLYDPTRDANQRLPARLEDLVSDPNQPDELAAAAMALIAKAGREDALPTLVRVAISNSSKPARSDAALQALSSMVTNLTVAQVMPLFTSAARDKVVANRDFCDAVAKVCSSEIDQIQALAFGDDAQVRLFALSCLADHCALPDAVGNEKRRDDLTTRIAPLLVKSTPPEVLTPAVRMSCHLLLFGTAPQLLALGPDIDALNLPDGTNSDLIKKTLGQAFIITTSPEDKARSDALVKALGAAVADQRTRLIADGALKLITSSTDLPSLRGALDQLAAAGDPDSMDALKTLVTTAYGRPDAVKSVGDDGTAWQTFFAKERAVATRYAEIKDWLEKNSKYLRVADGSRRLQSSLTFLQKAADETKTWVNDPDFVVPLGLAKNDVPDLVGDLNMLMADVKHALAGAEQDSDPNGTPAAAPAPAPAPDAAAPAGGDAPAQAAPSP